MTDIGSVAENSTDVSGIAEEDLLRANCYGLLASALLAPPTAEFLDILKGLQGDDSPFGAAMAALGGAAQTTDPDDIRDEFTRLFYGHGAGGELHPYASFYLTGFIYDKHVAPWATKFFEDLEAAENADFMRPVGTIGKLLMEIENQAFSIAA